MGSPPQLRGTFHPHGVCTTRAKNFNICPMIAEAQALAQSLLPCMLWLVASAAAEARITRLREQRSLPWLLGGFCADH